MQRSRLCRDRDYAEIEMSSAENPQLLLFRSRCFTSTKAIRLIRDGQMEVGEEGDYIPIAALSQPECVCDRMTPALRWAAMRAILVSLIVRDKVIRQCPQITEEKSSRGPSAY